MNAEKNRKLNKNIQSACRYAESLDLDQTSKFRYAYQMNNGASRVTSDSYACPQDAYNALIDCVFIIGKIVPEHYQPSIAEGN